MMKVFWFALNQRRRRLLAAALTLAAAILPLDLRSVAQQIPGLPNGGSTTVLPTVLPTVVRIEEDWALTVGTPNANLSCPQVSVQMAPSPDSTEFYQFHLNSQDIPKFVQGGLQLQAWNDTTVLAVKTSPDMQTLGTAGELITWTQYLAKQNDGSKGLAFGISAASSVTWGDFSGASFVVNGDYTVLDNYSPDYSVQNSGITYGVNLVTSLILVQTRMYYSDGSTVTDVTPRVVYNAN
jgi:hypothetical protein